MPGRSESDVCPEGPFREVHDGGGTAFAPEAAQASVGEPGGPSGDSVPVHVVRVLSGEKDLLGQSFHQAQAVERRGLHPDVAIRAGRGDLRGYPQGAQRRGRAILYVRSSLRLQDVAPCLRIVEGGLLNGLGSRSPRIG